MLKASIATPTLATIVALLRSLVDEVLVRVSRDGWHITAVDSAHVAMLDLQVPKASFKEYEAEDCQMGVDLDKLNDILKVVGSEGLVSMTMAAGSHLVLRFGRITRRVATLDTTNMRVPAIPNLRLDAKVTLPNGELLGILKAADAVCDMVKFTLEKDGLTIEGNGDTDDVQMHLGIAELPGIVAETPAKSSFSLDYLSKFAAQLGKSPMELSLASDMPLLADCKPHGMPLKFLLAPRIESA